MGLVNRMERSVSAMQTQDSEELFFASQPFTNHIAAYRRSNMSDSYDSAHNKQREPYGPLRGCLDEHLAMITDINLKIS